jgi:hypothetical protein
MGFVLRWPFEQQLFDDDITAARTALGDAEFDTAYAEGRALDPEAAVAYATRTRDERSDLQAGTTPRPRDE